MTLARETASILQGFGVAPDRFGQGSRVLRSPLTGAAVGRIEDASAGDVDRVVTQAQQAFLRWRSVPAPGAASS